uniref:Uncharacterized protein n=1 Tax=Oryza nivara TaxID=4536 RepID=A0A0E0H9X5_ORYNI
MTTLSISLMLEAQLEPGSQPLDKLTLTLVASKGLNFNQQYIMQPRGDKFSNGQKCVVDRIGHTFFHCSMERPISAWITSITAPATTQPLGHFILSYHKEDSLHVCLLSFVWLYMDSIDMLFRGLDHFILIRHYMMT